MFVYGKFEGKCKGKNMEKKNRRKIKEINYFYKLLQIHFIYFNSSKEKLNNLKMCKFLTSFNCIWKVTCPIKQGKVKAHPTHFSHPCS